MTANKFDKKGIWVGCHCGGGGEDETTAAGAAWQPQISAGLCIHTQCLVREQGIRKSCQHSFMNRRNYISLHIPFLPRLPHFLLFSLPFCYLRRLFPEFRLLLGYPLLVSSFELRLQIVFSVYSSRYEKLF